MRKRRFALRFAGVTAALVAFGPTARAVDIPVFSNAADARIEDDSGDDSTRDGLGSFSDDAATATSLVGSFNTDRHIALVFPFQLPADVVPDDITGATASFFLSSRTGTPPFTASLTALSRTSASPALQLSDFEGPGTALDAAFATTSSPTGQYLVHSSAALTEFLQDQYTSAGAGNYVFFRLKPSAADYTASVGYVFSMANQTGTAQDPLLTLTVVPEPAGAATLSVAAGLLLARHRRRAGT